MKAAYAVISGLISGTLIGVVTEYYTSADYKHVKEIARQSQTGSATTIISGLSVGMLSTALPIFFICVAILTSFYFFGLYGIALAGLGMLSTAGITIAVDAYGPIADNAGGIAEMSELPSSVRSITDRLDAVGNTTQPSVKDLRLVRGSDSGTFRLYAETANLERIDILSPLVVVGLFIGGVLPFVFTALTMQSVSRATNSMIEEVRRQFREIPGIMDGSGTPDYAKCVDISTKQPFMR